MASAYVLRVWIPDRPGALGALASRIGAVGGDVVGIDILERGAGRAIDEISIELPDPSLIDLLLSEIHQVDGVDVESIRPTARSVHDPRLDALETAAMLVGARTVNDAVSELCIRARLTIGAVWSAVVSFETGLLIASDGALPPVQWISAFVEGSRHTESGDDVGAHGDDITWAPMYAAECALVLGRDGDAFRSRERRQVAALARIVDARFADVRRAESMVRHPSGD